MGKKEFVQYLPALEPPNKFPLSGARGGYLVGSILWSSVQKMRLALLLYVGQPTQAGYAQLEGAYHGD